MLYFIRPAPENMTSGWEGHYEKAENLREALKVRTWVAKGSELPTSGIAIYDQKGKRVK